MSTLSALALSTILNTAEIDHQLVDKQKIIQIQPVDESEKFIGVASPLPANSEDISDNVYIA